MSSFKFAGKADLNFSYNHLYGLKKNHNESYLPQIHA
jgi:hypothetical protein